MIILPTLILEKVKHIATVAKDISIVVSLVVLVFATPLLIGGLVFLGIGYVIDPWVARNVFPYEEISED